MAKRKKIAFAMMGQDLAFLASTLEFAAGGIEPGLENFRGDRKLSFERALDEHFPSATTARTTTSPRPEMVSGYLIFLALPAPVRSGGGA